MKKQPRPEKRRARKFFRFRYSGIDNVAARIELINKNKLLRPGQVVFCHDIKQPGFPNYPEVPRLRCNAAARRALNDKLNFHGYWLVSQKMKDVIAEVDPAAVAFNPCEIVDLKGTAGPVYWLCDVIRIIDALDEDASDVEVYQHQNGKSYNMGGSERLVFKEEVVGNAHIFRIANGTIICDQIFRDACKTAKLRGIRFLDADQTRPLDQKIRSARSLVKLFEKDTSATARESPKLWLAHNLIEFADDQGDADSLKEAISLFRAVIAAGWRPSRPDVAKVCNDIGLTLLKLHRYTPDASFVDEAVEAFKEAEKYASEPTTGFRYDGLLLQKANEELRRSSEGIKQADALLC